MFRNEDNQAYILRVPIGTGYFEMSCRSDIYILIGMRRDEQNKYLQDPSSHLQSGTPAASCPRIIAFFIFSPLVALSLLVIPPLRDGILARFSLQSLKKCDKCRRNGLSII